MHYYEFNIGNYRKDTTHLTHLEHGIYRALIDTYYANESPLCSDHAQLMRTHSIRTNEEILAFKNIINDFFILEDGFYHHSGCDKQLEIIYSKSKKAALAANKKWALYKKRKEEKEAANAKAMLESCERIENECERIEKLCPNDAQSMLPNNPTTQQPNYPTTQLKTYVEFSEFWDIYHRKESKAESEKIWKKLKVDQELFDQIKKHLAIAYLETDKKFIPHASTYLNKKRWLDEITLNNKSTLLTIDHGQGGAF